MSEMINLNMNTNLMNNEPQLNYEIIVDFLKTLASPDNQIRKIAEDYFSTLKYEIQLYQILFNIFKSENIEKYYRLQSILLIKNLIRIDLTSHRMRRFQENESLKDVNLIVDLIQKELIEIINLGKYDETYKSHLKELFILIADKKFPSEWQELNFIFSNIYEMPIQNLINNDNTFQIVFNLNELFYSLLKMNNRKRTPQARNRFLQFKKYFIEMFTPFYERVILFFNENSNQFSNMEFIEKFLSLMIINDKILLVLIDSSFYINDFHKDDKILIMLKTILDKTFNILDQINNNPIQNIKEYLNKNLYKILKSLGKIQSSSPVIFYKELSRYVNILMLIIINCNYFTQEILKVVLFDIYKLINTISYKELQEDIIIIRKGSMPNNLFDNNLSKTPEKPKRCYTPHLVSPSKFKNFETELQEANEIFYQCFNEENLRIILENLIKKVPFNFKKENENLELELLAEIEEDMTPSEIFSPNTMSWQMLYKNLLESLISNFPNFSIKYIKEILEILYSTQETNENLNNILIIDSVINFVNLLPNLYKSGQISEMEIIDYTKFINYVESFINKSEIIMKKYIVTISKWSEVLISNDQIFNYIENLIFFLDNSKNNIILLESCLAIKNIIQQFDNFLKNGHSSLNVYVNKKQLEENIKTKINWGIVLSHVSNVCLNFLQNVKSAELLNSLINLFTQILQKCHFQCDGNILEIIRNSKLSEIINQRNDEFAQNSFIEMWKTLLVTFSKSEIILDLTLQFTSVSLKREINQNNLGLLLFTLRIIDLTDEIRNLCLNFLRCHIIIFQTNQKQYLSIILFNILEEFSLLDIFDINDAINIIKLCQDKYIPLYESTKEILSRDFNQSKESKEYINDFFLGDISEYKASIINVVNTLFVFFSNKNIDITEHLKIILKIIFEEILLYNNISSCVQFVSSVIPLVNRISIVNFDYFSKVLNEFLNERNLPFDKFFNVWISTMDQIITSDSRLLNVITIAKIMPLLDKSTLLNNLNNIFDICLMTVYSEMMKKIILENSECRVEKLNLNIPKSLNIKQSIRKKQMLENDNLNKIDIHSFFIENLKISLNNIGISIEELLNQMSEHRLISTLKNVLGIEQIIN